MIKITEEKTFVDGLRINYKVAGSGPAILVLHGWGGSSNSWVKVMEFLADKGFKVFSLDFPGFGKSSSPKDAWGIKAYTDFVFGFVKKMELKEFFLLGHSFGGRVSIRFSVLYPEKVKKLVLCDSAGIKAELDFKAKMIFRITRLGNMIFSPKITARFKDFARNVLYVFLRRKDYAKAKGIMRGVMKKVIEEDLSSDLEKINSETLIVWGEKDKSVPLKYAYIFEEKIKNSELEVIPGIGHSPNLECPKDLSNIISKFLKK